ncbi:TrmH family RNA methyltransferase [Bdellovibrio reynosensis]|uniref:RNA methyltransferase n=1 Tax=Bdellovibrio reynosensis TaxID=2835041 RepID=A0ABY4CBW1_9BACT|nr:RNA methyltransferase [Bdellovibrio reynosensis]UOF01196.1 RNA methyltransferase [Bdellovibrio reynosensis]
MKKNNSRPSGKSQSQQRPSQGRQQRPQAGGRPQQNQVSRSENHIPREWRIVIGTHAINEVLKVRPREVKGMWLRQGWENSNDLRDMQALAEKARIKIDIKADQVIEKFGPSQQGAAVFVDGAPDLDIASLEKFEKSVVLMLDGIEDPHNLGAILRTSWLIGAHGVLIPEDRAVGLTPTVHKVACGGVEHVPVEETTNFGKYAEELKKQGYWIFGLSPRGTKSIFELDLPEKVVWAVGSEDKGLRVTTERLCDELVFIPQASSSASYNASVATAMALTETLRQHAARGNRKKS